MVRPKKKMQGDIDKKAYFTVLVEYWRRGGDDIQNKGIFFYRVTRDRDRPTLMDCRHQSTEGGSLTGIGDKCLMHLPIAYASVMVITSILDYLEY